MDSTWTDDNRKSLTQALTTLTSHTADAPSTTTTTNDPQSQSQAQAADNEVDASDPPASTINLPPEIIDYVDSARNPDIYTREFVELVQRGNQDLKGKMEAFAGFRDVLAREIRGGMPECSSEVGRVLDATGGSGSGSGSSGSGVLMGEDRGPGEEMEVETGKGRRRRA